ncbi:MAG: hypothetical protein QW215_06245, partial [Ignisphaera sp.]
LFRSSRPYITKWGNFLQQLKTILFKSRSFYYFVLQVKYIENASKAYLSRTLIATSGIVPSGIYLKVM